MGISSKALKAKADSIKAGGSTEAVVMPAAVFTEGTVLKAGTVAEPLQEATSAKEVVDNAVDTAVQVEESTAQVTVDVPASPVPGAKPLDESGKPVEVLKESEPKEVAQALEVAGSVATTVHAAPAEEVAKQVQELVQETTEAQETTSVVGSIATQQDVSQADSPIQSQPTLADSNAFQQLTRTSEETGIGSNSSYAELVESMVSQQCQLSGVKNLDLTTFGLRAQVLTFPNLSVMTYGSHKFLGAPFTEEEENLIVHRLAVHVAQSDKSRIVVKAVQEVKDERGMSFYSLLFDERIAQKFVNMFNYTVHANLNEADVSKLVLVIQK